MSCGIPTFVFYPTPSFFHFFVLFNSQQLRGEYQGRPNPNACRVRLTSGLEVLQLLPGGGSAVPDLHLFVSLGAPPSPKINGKLNTDNLRRGEAIRANIAAN